MHYGCTMSINNRSGGCLQLLWLSDPKLINMISDWWFAVLAEPACHSLATNSVFPRTLKSELIMLYQTVFSCSLVMENENCTWDLR